MIDEYAQKKTRKEFAAFLEQQSSSPSPTITSTPSPPGIAKTILAE